MTLWGVQVPSGGKERDVAFRDPALRSDKKSDFSYLRLERGSNRLTRGVRNVGAIKKRRSRGKKGGGKRRLRLQRKGHGLRKKRDGEWEDKSSHRLVEGRRCKIALTADGQEGEQREAGYGGPSRKGKEE